MEKNSTRGGRNVNQFDYRGPVEGLRTGIGGLNNECERYVRLLAQVDRAVPCIFGIVLVLFLLAFFRVVRNPFPLLIGYFILMIAVFFYRQSLVKKVFEKRKIDLARDFVNRGNGYSSISVRRIFPCMVN